METNIAPCHGKKLYPSDNPPFEQLRPGRGERGIMTVMHLSGGGGGGGGGEGGGAGGGDLTFFTNLLSNSLPAGKSFQSNATKFPHPGLHIATKYTKAEPKKGTMKIDFVSLYFRLL